MLNDDLSLVYAKAITTPEDLTFDEYLKADKARTGSNGKANGSDELLEKAKALNVDNVDSGPESTVSEPRRALGSYIDFLA